MGCVFTESPQCHGLEACLAEDADGVGEQGFRWLSSSSKLPAALHVKKRIGFLRKMLYLNAIPAMEITNKYYFDTSLRHRRFLF